MRLTLDLLGPCMCAPAPADDSDVLWYSNFPSKHTEPRIYLFSLRPFRPPLSTYLAGFSSEHKHTSTFFHMAQNLTLNRQIKLFHSLRFSSPLQIVFPSLILCAPVFGSEIADCFQPIEATWETKTYFQEIRRRRKHRVESRKMNCENMKSYCFIMVGNIHC